MYRNYIQDSRVRNSTITLVVRAYIIELPCNFMEESVDISTITQGMPIQNMAMPCIMLTCSLKRNKPQGHALHVSRIQVSMPCMLDA